MLIVSKQSKVLRLLFVWLFSFLLVFNVNIWFQSGTQLVMSGGSNFPVLKNAKQQDIQQNEVPLMDKTVKSLLSSTTSIWEEKRDLIVISSQRNIGISTLPWGPIGKYWVTGVSVNSQKELQDLVNNPSVKGLFSDLDGQIDVFGVSKGLVSKGEILPNSFRVQEITNATNVFKLNITGNGVVVGLVDSGVDFGVTSLKNAFVRDVDGLPAAFDPTGAGIVITPYEVAPVTRNDNVYLPLAGVDFPVWLGENFQLSSVKDLGIQLQDIEITDIPIKSVSNTYKVGLGYFPSGSSFQANSSFSFTQIYPFVLVDSSDTGLYDTLYVDLDTGLALSLMYSSIIFEGSSIYERLSDWSLNDETPFNITNPVLARDVTNDQVNDASAGMLGQTLDTYGLIEQNALIRGIDPQGRGVAVFYDFIGHGTSSATSIAGRPNTPFQVYDDPQTTIIENTTIYYLPGSAPEAKIIPTKFVGASILEIIFDWYWVSGLTPALVYDPQVGKEVMTWVFTNTHRANITNNSFGYPSIDLEGSIKGLDLLSMFIDFLSYPKTVAEEYPGMLFVVATGNSGPGYGTVSMPASAGSALTVGSSNTKHYLSGAYGFEQGYDQVSFFSSRGPTTQGLIKPDVVHIGETGFVSGPVIFGRGNGTLAFTEFIGTSQAAPYATGVAALVLEAMNKQGIAFDPGLIKQAIMGTADDLYYESISQGSGRINAERAVKYILGLEPALIPRDGTQRYAKLIEPAFQSLFGAPPPGLNTNIKLVPNFLGDVNPGKNVSITYSLQFINGTILQTNISLFYYSLVKQQSFQVQTKKRVTFVNLETYGIHLNYGDTLKVKVFLDKTATSFYKRHETFPKFMLFEFQTDDGDSVPEQRESDQEAEMRIMQESPFEIWKLQLDFSKNQGGVDAPLYLRVIDPGFSEDTPTWTGMQFTVTMEQYTRVSYSNATVTNESNEVRFTLENTQEAPQWIALQAITSYDGFQYQVPFSVNFLKQFPEAPAYLDFENNEQEYFNPKRIIGNMNFASYARGDQGDTISYRALVPNDSQYLAIRVEWMYKDTMVDVYISNEEGTVIKQSYSVYLGGSYYYSQSSEPTAQNLLLSSEGLQNDKITITLHVVNITSELKQEQLTLKLRSLTQQELPMPTLSYSQDPSQPISGDLSVEVQPFQIPELPELKLTNYVLETRQIRTNLTIQDELRTTSIIQGEGTPDASFQIQLQTGVGTLVTLEWDNPNVDLDVYVISNSKNIEDLNNDVLLGTGKSSNDLERGIFTPEETNYTILVDYVSGVQDVTFTLRVLQYQTSFLQADSNLRISLDTKQFPNGQYLFNSSIETNFDYTFVIVDVINFKNQVPSFTVTITQPSNDEVLDKLVIVKWTVSDENFNTVFTIEVKEVNQGSWILLGIVHNLYTYQWNTSLFGNGSYELKVTGYLGAVKAEDSRTVIVLNNQEASTQTSKTLFDTNFVVTFSLWIGIVLLLKKKIRSKNN